MTLYRRGSGFYGWERKHPLLKDGRISISLRTKDKKEAVRRERALDLLVERGEWAVLARLREGTLHVLEIADAVKGDSLATIRSASLVNLSLGAMATRVTSTKEATRTKGTQRKYAHYTSAMLRQWGPDRLITDISIDEIRAWLYEPKGKKKKAWAPNTQLSAIMVGGYLWRQAIEVESEAMERSGAKPRITRDPWAKIEVSERAQPRRAFLEPKEWLAVLNSAGGKPQAALLGVLCLAGLRMREALNLRTGIDVDLAAGLIRVQARDGEYAWTTKNDNSQRDVPIAASLTPLLVEHVEAGYAGARYFFHAPRWDRPMAYQSGLLIVKAAIERAGLKYGRDGELTAHSFRHTFASWLVREGWSSSLVAALLGNTAEEVDKTYAHLRPKDLKKVVGTLDKLTGYITTDTGEKEN